MDELSSFNADYIPGSEAFQKAVRDYAIKQVEAKGEKYDKLNPKHQIALSKYMRDEINRRTHKYDEYVKEVLQERKKSGYRKNTFTN